MNIICFGDSITRGYDVREGLGWVELCSAALPAYISILLIGLVDTPGF